MGKVLSFDKVVHEAVKRGIDPFFRDRLFDMVWHITRGNDGTHSLVTNLHVSKDWPLRGTIRFTRVEDGKRFKLYLTKHKWKAVEV